MEGVQLENLSSTPKTNQELTTFVQDPSHLDPSTSPMTDEEEDDEPKEERIGKSTKFYPQFSRTSS